ncbi:MAG: hypothetical protein JSV22_03115 [Bacteroidales bacterium]|nr:MAG: hypothetical protein JSV22_03115 [Bacteroidales bacterium]
MVLLNMLIIIVYGLVISTGPNQSLKPPEKIIKLGLSRLDGEVPVYYSEEYKTRAAYIQNLVVSASCFFKTPEILGVDADLHLAVLDSSDWTRYTKLPYGIAHIIAEPPTIIVAASADNVIVRNILAKEDKVSEITLKLLDELEISYNEAATTFADLISFHELGHILANKYGCDTWPEQRWLSEFVATYLAYAYMKEKQPKLSRLWKAMMDQNACNSEVKHTTLADFETLYLGVGTDNYGWFQAKFYQKVEEIYSESGISFVHELKKLLNENPKTSKDDIFRLKELSSISKGFSGWAEGKKGNIK